VHVVSFSSVIDVVASVIDVVASVIDVVASVIDVVASVIDVVAFELERFVRLETAIARYEKTIDPAVCVLFPNSSHPR
jgi:hypothetical protein